MRGWRGGSSRNAPALDTHYGARSGWLAGRNTLSRISRDPAHAWLAVMRAYDGCCQAIYRGRKWGRERLESGWGATPLLAHWGGWRELGYASWRAMSRKGLALLDEVGVAAVPGSSMRSRPAWSTAKSCARCRHSGSTTSQRNGRRRWRAGATDAGRSLHGRCRIPRAEILRLRRWCAEAEPKYSWPARN